MKKFKIFLYFFLLSGMFSLSSIYIRENFDQPFNSLGTMDVIRIIMAGIVETASLILIYDTYIRFKEISKTKKNVLLFLAITLTLFYLLILVPVYY